MVYGYARCSTNQFKQDIDRQKNDLLNKGVEIANIYWEYESGCKDDRIQLQRLLERVQEGDVIIATEVSRITRSTQQLCDILGLAKKNKIKLVFGELVVDCTRELDPMTEGMLKMMGVFSELEKNIISQRVKSGVANAKAKGKHIGRPPMTKKDIPPIFLEFYPDYKNARMSKLKYAKLVGVSVPTLYKYLELVEKGN